MKNIEKQNNKIKGAVLTFEKWHGKEYIGSSRIRGHWLVKAWNKMESKSSSLEVFQQGAKYDAIIFQKTYWPAYCKEYKGIKILDMCDPDWLEMMEVKQMIDECDAVTTSTEALRDAIKQFTDKSVIHIPDRHDLNEFTERKVHQGQAKWVCWFGYSHNNRSLDMVMSTLKKYNLKLKVISNCRPFYSKADKNVKYEWENPNWSFNKELLECDFVVMPPNTTPRGKYKSQNKIITSWALGMPVATNPNELKRFMDSEERKKEAEKRLQEVREKWDIRTSVQQFQQLINDIKKWKK